MSNGHTTFLRDDNGIPTGHGDAIRYSFGMPPTEVIADIIQRDGKLFAVCPEGLYPRECNLRSLRRYVGGWRLWRVRT